ncbi:hypothetical protein VTN96DRAFT_7005 [Rasamsonia emersonii]
MQQQQASTMALSLGNWGFQYHPEHGHRFAIEKGVNIVVPGILDYTESSRRGCQISLERLLSPPRLHCLGISTRAAAQSWLLGATSHFADIEAAVLGQLPSRNPQVLRASHYKRTSSKEHKDSPMQRRG